MKDNIDIKGVVTSAGSDISLNTICPRRATRTALLSRARETFGLSERQISVNLRWLPPA